METSLAVHYLAGNVPGGKLGIGWSTVQDAMMDLQPSPSGLQLMDIQNHLEDLGKTTGPGSSKKKRQILRALFSKTGARERKLLVGLILGEIRQGALEGLVLEAIAEAISCPLDSIRQAFMFSGNIGRLAEVALEEGSAGLGRFGPRLFHPVSPMLASPAEGEQEALARLGEAAWEYKVDGARIQIHKGREKIRIFTRHLKEVTERPRTSWR